MRSKKTRWSKTILSLLLSAVLAMEPLGTAAVVNAEENDGTIVQTGTEFEEDTDRDAGEDAEKNEEEFNQSKEDESSKDDDGKGKETPNETPDNPNDEENQDDVIEQQPDEGDENVSDAMDESGDGADQGEDEKDTMSENDLDEEEKDETLEGFTEMPEDYRMSSVQMASKRELANYLDEIMELDEGADYVKGEVVLLVDSREEAEQIAEAYNAEIKKFEYGVLTLKLNNDDTVVKAIRVAADEKINLPAVWPNYYVYAYGEEPVEGVTAVDSEVERDDIIEIVTSEYELEALEESDELSYLPASYSDEFLSPDKGLEYQYHHTVIGSPYAWEAKYTGSGVKVAVLDTGVNSKHPDLPSVTSKYAAGTSDSNGHGTHVAGIIAAQADGKLGVGVAPGVSLYAGNVLPNNGSGTLDDTMAGVRAVSGQSGATVTVDIINMSLGSLGYSEDFQTVITAAYNNGVAIFAAAGNDGGNNYNYPACYDHVISVAATDQSNARASFSNYCNKVDLSAPGVDIYSTNAFYDQTGQSSYVLKSGTSMACPVAAGEAAVILSAKPAELDGKTGGDKVDALLKLMQNNAIKVGGSGMGAGITNLAKVFNINRISEKPATPTIIIEPDGELQKVNVTMKAQVRTQIYYTVNGKNPVYKNGAPDANTKLYTESFSIEDRVKCDLRAIAVSEDGVCSKIVRKVFTLKPYVNSITISGLNQVAKGKSIQLSAVVMPTYAANKAVTWEIYTADEAGKPDQKIDKYSDKTLKTGVSITNKGKVAATKAAKPGSYIVKVTAKDLKKDSTGQIIHEPVSTTYAITVTETVKINSVKFAKKSLNLVMPKDTGVDLVADGIFVAMQKDSDGSLVNAAASNFNWSSNNKAVAEVDSKGVVTLHKAGKAVITALANDSSGKKAACTIIVQRLAESLEISGSAVIGKSKSIVYKAVVTPADTTNKKVTWSLSEKDAQGQWQPVNSKRAKELGVSINASGKLTTTKKAIAGEYLIKAVTKDSEKAEAKIEGTKEVTVKDGLITKITVKPEYSTIYRIKNAFDVPTETGVKITVAGSNGADLTAYTVTGSDAKETIAKITEGTKGPDGTMAFTVTATGKATGKLTITVKATDGSNKSAKCTINVNNPISGIRISPSGSNNECVAKGKSLQLKAIVETEKGTVANKKVVWQIFGIQDESLVPATRMGMKISASGKITAAKKAETGWYYVYAIAKDGSAWAKYPVHVADPVKFLRVNGLYSGATTSLFPENDGIYAFLITSDIKQGGYSLSSSNPAVVSVGIDSTGYRMQLVTGKKGTATITVKAMDGSGKQVKYKIKVDTKLYERLKK